MKVEEKNVKKDLIVIGGGIPGVIAAIQAARLGTQVGLVNDRGHLGGNASAEIRVWINGADGSQDYNFYSREGGIIEELRLEQLYRSWQHTAAPDSSAYWYNWDALLRDFIEQESNIEVFLETYIDEVEMTEEGSIRSVSGTQSGTETRYKFNGDLFLDDTGHGTIGYLAGADFNEGRESIEEFGESIAPQEADDYVIPSTLTWCARDTGKKVEFVPPDFAMDIEKTDALEYRSIPGDDFHRMQWYYELGGDRNQIKDSREIMKDHQSLVYGIWDYIKNSGKYESETYALEYVACIPGWRESRRLLGDHILTEQDIVGQKEFVDVVGHGGWSIDLHAIKGFFAKEPKNEHIFLKGIYQIPYRCCYSRNISNLFMAGRCMSASHVGFGSTRVIATLSTLAQATGAAASLCKKYNKKPQQIYEDHINELQQILLKQDQYIVGKKNEDAEDLVLDAEIEASSSRDFKLTSADEIKKLNNDFALIIPVKNQIEQISLLFKNEKVTELAYEVYTPDNKFSYYPEDCVKRGTKKLDKSSQLRWVNLAIEKKVDNNKLFIKLKKNKNIKVGTAQHSLVGVISLSKKSNDNPRIIDVETLKPRDHIWEEQKTTICFRTQPREDIYMPQNINNGYHRPYGVPNLWISEVSSKQEWIKIKFKQEKAVNNIKLFFDSQLNTNINYYHENEIRFIPALIKKYEIYYLANDEYKKAKVVANNNQRVNDISLENIITREIKIKLKKTNGQSAFHLYEVRIY